MHRNINIRRINNNVCLSMIKKSGVEIKRENIIFIHIINYLLEVIMCMR